jgi:hypothetical protein
MEHGKMAFGDFRSKAARSHAASLISWNTNFGGKPVSKYPVTSFVQNHMEVGVLVDNPTSPKSTTAKQQ